MLIERNRSLLALGAGTWIIFCGAAHAGDPGAPPTAQQTVTDTYHGVTVSDPYRWLENSNSGKVHEWSAAQDKRTRTYLDALPERGPIYKQLLSPDFGNLQLLPRPALRRRSCIRVVRAARRSSSP